MFFLIHIVKLYQYGTWGHVRESLSVGLHQYMLSNGPLIKYMSVGLFNTSSSYTWDV